MYTRFVHPFDRVINLPQTIIDHPELIAAYPSLRAADHLLRYISSGVALPSENLDNTSWWRELLRDGGPDKEDDEPVKDQLP